MGGKGGARKEVDKKLAMARQDRNLRTMEPENSQIWIFSRHFLRSWCPFYLCYIFKIHFGSDHLMNIAPTSLSHFLGSSEFWALRLQGDVFVALQSFRHLDVPCFSSISSFHDAGIWGYVSWGLRLRWGGFCCARKLPSEVTSPFHPFIRCPPLTCQCHWHHLHLKSHPSQHFALNIQLHL